MSMTMQQEEWVDAQTEKFLGQIARQTQARGITAEEYVEVLRGIMATVEVRLQAAKETA
jgi:hypothetical protein